MLFSCRKLTIVVDSFREEEKQVGKYINTFGRKKGEGIFALEKKIDNLKNPKLKKEMKKKYAEKYKNMAKHLQRKTNIDDYNMFISKLITQVSDPI